MTVIDRRYAVAEGLAIKAPCRVATTANITLSGEQTIDGVAVVEGDRVLVKNQTTGSENGIYDCSTGNWTRTRDFDGAFDVVTGTRVLVVFGTTNAESEFYVSTSGAITIDSTSIAFSKITVSVAQDLGTGDSPTFAGLTISGTVTAASLSVGSLTGVLRADSGVVSTDSDVTDLVSAATAVLAGKVELATETEAHTGTDTSRAVTPAGAAQAIEVAAIRTVTAASDTLVIGDRGQIVFMNRATAQTLTIPSEAAVDFPTGTVIGVVQFGAGTVTIQADTGVTLNGVSAGSGDIQTQYQGVSLLKIGTNGWMASGDIGTVA